MFPTYPAAQRPMIGKLSSIGQYKQAQLHLINGSLSNEKLLGCIGCEVTMSSNILPDEDY